MFWLRRNWFWLTLVGLLSIVMLLAGLALARPKPSPIPKAISAQLSFPVLYPTKTEQVKPSPASLKYDSQAKILNYTVIVFGINLTVTEQSVPESFGDAPQIYSALLDKLHQFKSIETKAGRVYLTRPEELKGGQTAVLNNQTLLFARPERDLTEDQWRLLFNGLEAVPPPR